MNKGTNRTSKMQTRSFSIPKLVMILFINATLLIACSTENEPLPKTPTAENIILSTPTTLSLATSHSAKTITAKPPAAILSNGTTQTEAALGSYCWHFEETSTMECDNVFNLAAPTEPLVVLANQQLTIHLPDKPLMLVTMRVLQWEKIEAEVQTGYTAMALDAPVLASGDLEPQSTIEWQAPPMPGEFMLDLMSVYENEGHVGYGWHILVE